MGLGIPDLYQELDAEPVLTMDTGEDSQIPSPSPASLPSATNATRGSSGELPVIRLSALQLHGTSHSSRMIYSLC